MNKKPAIMAVLNITPDSFSDGGELFSGARIDWDSLFAKAEQAVAEGATMLDVGGESTRPGADVVSEQQELDRVIPVIEALSSRFDLLVSVDTSNAVVMQAAVAVGAGFINDVRALQGANALSTAAALHVPVCLMHMQGQPNTMQHKPGYSQINTEVKDFLLARAKAFIGAGGKQEHIVIDQGFGFGKTLAHNVALFKSINDFAGLGYPLLVGVSRKSMFAAMTGRAHADRDGVSAMAAALAIEAGASMVRVHNVAATIDAIKTIQMLGSH